MVSLLRDFSAPVRLHHEQTEADRLFLLEHDANGVNRWLVAQELLEGRGIALACPETKQLCCYAGEESQVMARTEELAIRVDKERSEQREAFTDNVIMYEVLSELKDMAGRGGVRCTCGSRDYGIRIHRDAVDLTCRACGGRLRLPAATDEDLDQLCCRMTLEIPGRKDGV